MYLSAGLTVETPHDFDITELIPHRTTCQMSCLDPTPDNNLENPPYAISQAGGMKIYEKTIAMTASECTVFFLNHVTVTATVTVTVKAQAMSLLAPYARGVQP